MKTMYAVLASTLLAASLPAAAQYAPMGDGPKLDATVEKAVVPCPTGYAMVRIPTAGLPLIKCARLAFGLAAPQAGQKVVVQYDALGEPRLLGVSR